MSRLKVNRIGFVNFWLYDEEDFYFYDGKLLLRGTNGSGKTVTMQSFFPLIFDGNKSPERLDPFGSRDRKIEDYLLPDGFNGNENTGYLYMEFVNDNKYTTIGIGLRAIRNRGCEFWGFSITDGRRIGTDFLLFKERGLRIPLTKKELQTRIGTGGEFVESAKEYKKLVNKLLFGFQNISMYNEFINLLIQVRSPKLSNSTRPTQLTKILSSVLEPLSEEELRTMADSIEEMNKYKEKISDLKNEQKACDSLKLAYQNYNKFLLYTKGVNYLEQKNNYNQLNNDIKNKENEIKALISKILEEKENKKKLDLEQTTLEDKKSKLETSDASKYLNDLEDITNNINELSQSKQNKNIELESKENNLLNKRNDLKESEDDLYKVEREFNDLINELTIYEDDINYDDAKFYLDDLKKENLDFKQMSSYIQTLKRQIELLKKLEEISYEIYIKEQEISKDKEKYQQLMINNEDIIKKQTNISNELISRLDEFKNDIASSSINNEVLILNQDSLNSIYNIIDSLDREMFIKIKEILKNKIYEIKDNLSLELSNNKVKISEYKAKIDDLNNDLNNADNILTENLDNDETINYFKNKKIKYNYFYELIDFNDNIDILLKKKIEAFLADTGILTSFVIDDNVLDDIKLKCLSVGNKISNNLSKYLKPLDTIFKDKVLGIIESISLDEVDNIYFSDNKYKLSIIEGKTCSSYELKYIGDATREKYIEHTKEKINVNIKALEKQINITLEKINELNHKQDKLDLEFNKLEFPTIISELFKDLDKISLDLNINNDAISGLIDVINDKTKDLRLMNDKMLESKKGYYGPTNYLDIKKVLNSTNNYFDILKALSSTFDVYSNKNELVNMIRSNLLEGESDLDIIKEEISELDYKISQLNNKKENILSMLDNDYSNVTEEFNKIRNRLDIIKQEKESLIEFISRSERDREILSEQIEACKNNIADAEILKNVTYKVFMDEYNLAYISSDDIEENAIQNFIRTIKPVSLTKDIYDKFIDASNKYLPILINYASKYIFRHEVKENAYLDFTNDEKIGTKITDILDGAKRRDLLFNYMGSSISLIKLSDIIDSSIISYEQLISDENRHLFEDLLMNNVGASIRQKIHDSEEWISEIKNLMESMNTSSGLSFSLKWTGKEAMTEDEMNTSRIAELFKRGADALKEKDLLNITNHFKSKIKMKEESLEESERNYLEIIKEVLDYREWFEFKIYFKRGNGDRKELTDKEFNKMSGGEKAIAMYIPLFSSIYAKLNSAYDYAPHVIALDEAFAGVDDANINDAFRILDKLDIDYVLTSQQLWGDYETIKHLAISELYHPIGSRVVSTIKYKWDGKVRKLVDDVNEYQAL
ncbi:MAG: TIGR02680 family protein [Bacilli bacterium]|nr:TIGR02680 family protein [Bacilli bacterium]